MVPDSHLYRVTLLNSLIWPIFVWLLGAVAYLVVVVRRRDRARDPFEHADLALDPIARAARDNLTPRAREPHEH